MPKIIKKLIKLFCVLLVLGLATAALAVGIFIHLNSAPDAQLLAHNRNAATLRIENENVLILEVRSGESAISVGRRLEEAGIIRTQFLWRILSRLENDHIKTGTYRIALPISQLGIYSLLVEGRQILVRVTIPEGATLKRAGNALEAAGICSAADFIAAASSERLRELYNIQGETMEGFLFPDTYLFPLAYPAERVVMAMADNFFQRLSYIVPNIHAMDMAEINRRVILASIVEREYRVAEEAAIMAGVFSNRLRINMALQSCATVEYVITEILGRPHPRVLYFRDLEIPSPYNTYRQPGLPPGPISAPGEIALRAAFFPATTNYFFFRLIDPATGRHYFSRTMDEHIQAGTLYLKGPS